MMSGRSVPREVESTAADGPRAAGTGLPEPKSAAAALTKVPAAPNDTAAAAVTNRTSGCRFDFLLAVPVLLFAFSSASFVARNSDLWLHLASGRLLARGAYEIGVDPFAYTTQGVYWTNHAWLADLALYLVYRALGGGALVFLKAALITGLAWLMLRVRLEERSGWAPVACTALAVLAMSPRLLLQPVCASYFLLGLTFWLLWRPYAAASPETLELRLFGRAADARAVVPLLCALWVNLDGWFLLGPLLTGLFWVGDLWALPKDSPAGRRTPSWLLPGCVAACLCSPHHLHAFTLTGELSPVLYSSGLLQDVRFQGTAASPWQLPTYLQPSAGLNAAGLAYFALVALGLASFALNRIALRGWPILVWGAFALLGAWQIRLIPFFAVVAGPIAALNFQAVRSSRSADSSQPAVLEGNRPVGGRFVLVLSTLVLLALTWSGWLHGLHAPAYAVAWSVQPDPSLQRLATTMQEWRRQGRLRDGDHGFAFHPDVADYLAWFCPEEKGFFDSRLSLFPHVAGTFEAVCRELDPSLANSAKGKDPNGVWRKVFQDWGITHLIFYDPEGARALPTESALARNYRQWDLLDIEGGAWVLAPKDGRLDEVGRSAENMQFDAYRLAFGEHSENEELGAPTAPPEGPGRGPKAPDLWPSFAAAVPVTWQSEAAGAYLSYFHEGLLPRYYERLASSWSCYGAGVAAFPPLDAPPPVAVAPLLAYLHERPLFMGEIDRDLPALPLLAVRTARCALVANPEDANAYLQLGRAYLALWEMAGERPLSKENPLLADLRQIQAATALEHAVLADHDLEAPHRLLAKLYAEIGFLDASLDHLREELRLVRRSGPRRGEDQARFQQRLARVEHQVTEMEHVVKAKQNEFSNAGGEGPADATDRARVALRLGLARRALDDILSQTPAVLLESSGLQIEIRLVLRLGRAEQLRSRMLDLEWEQEKANLGVLELPAPPIPGYPKLYRLPAYSWMRLCWLAAVGDYDLADSQLREILELLERQRRERLESLTRSLSLALTAEIGLAAQPQPPMLWCMAQDGREGVMRSLERTRSFLADQSDLQVLGGVLALERGLPLQAERSFEEALRARQPGEDGAHAFATRALADVYLKRIKAAK